MPEEKPLAADFHKEDSLLKRLPRSPILWSKNATSDVIRVEHQLHPPDGTSECCLSHHALSIHIGRAIHLEQVADGRLASNRMRYGDLIISPPNLHRQLRWDRQAEFIFLRLEPKLFAYAAYETVDAERVETVPQFKLRDPLIQQIGLALKSELESDGAGSRLYLESMANALAVHLLRRYSARKLTIRNYTDGLPEYKLRQAIEYINGHLAENLSLGAIATELGMSRYYFCRLFKQSMGITPYQYLLHCRIERAKQLLLQGKPSIAQVALEVGFTSQSQFTKHFKRLIGVTPKEIFKK